MAQFGRPSADTYRGNWVDQASGTSSIYATIDETVASNTDYIQSEAAPASSAYATKLSSVTDPVSSIGHIVRYRYSKSAAGGSQIDLVVQLRKAYSNEGAQGTLVASNTHTNVSDTWTDGTFTLSGAEADAITDYNDLFLRVVATQV